ncbi:MAG: trigger factor [Candidatus Veblenbacteria bacterium]|nr:trigger factor [Candidatus Veblenbacteria bacterium]
MEHQVAPVAGGKIQITFTLTTAEQARFELRALRAAGSLVEVKGFRAGHVPDEVVRKQVGEEQLQQDAMWEAVKEFYPELVHELALDVVGSPVLALQSVEPFVFHVTVARLPDVDLGKWDKVKVKRKAVEVAEDDVAKFITQIRESRASEAAVARPAKLGDRVEIDFEVSQGGVIIEGGKETKYPTVLGQGRLVPGFEDNLIGMSAGEEKRFEITFPKDYRADLAGKKAQVVVKLKQVFQRTLPEVTDEFARTLGKFTSAEDFKAKLRENLLEEHTQLEDQRVEREMLEALVERAHFSELPEVLLKSEAEKMLHELKAGITERGLDWPQYLLSIKKDEAALKKEFSTPAERRVKVALIVRIFAKQEKLEADEAAVEEDIAHALSHYGNDKRAVAQLNSDDYRDYVRQTITNRLVIEWLKAKLVE